MTIYKTLFLVLSTVYLSACGGGGAGDAYAPTGTATLITPSTANIEVGQSLPLRITGGLGPYTLTSSNQIILPVPNKIDNLHAADLVLTTGPAYKTEVVEITVVDSKGSKSLARYTINTTALAANPSSLNLSATKSQTITIIGGRSPFTITSSNPEILTIDTSNVEAQRYFTVSANRTATRVDNIVVNVVDANGTTVSSRVSVVPFEAFTSILVTPSDTSGTIGSISAGKTGSVTVKVNDTYTVPRTVSIRKLLGDFSFHNADNSGTVLLEIGSNGIGISTLTVNSGAPTQTAKFRVIDIETGKYIDSSFQIAGAALSASPEKFSATSTNATGCFAGQVGALQIMGGTPPYTILSESPATLSAAPTTISQNGGVTILTATGVCPGTTGVNISVTDAAGTKTLVPYTSTAKVDTTLPSTLTTQPTTLSGPVGADLSATISGGTAPYTATSSNAGIASVTSITGTRLLIRTNAIGTTEIVIRDSMNKFVSLPVTVN